MLLTIGDNGVGLPPELDFQHSPSLGLTLVNTLVRQIKGKIDLDNRSGTTFKIIFSDIGR